MSAHMQQLSIPMRRELARMLKRGAYETSTLPTATGEALKKRGLVEIKRYSLSGVVCLMTDEGRRRAEALR